MGDLFGQALGHIVERRREPGDVVLAAHGHAFLEAAVGESDGDSGGRPDRDDHLPGHQPRDGGEQSEQHDGTGEQGAAHEIHHLLFIGEREHQVQLKPGDRRLVGVPTMSAGDVGAGAVVDGRVLVGDLPALHHAAQIGGHLVGRPGDGFVAVAHGLRTTSTVSKDPTSSNPVGLVPRSVSSDRV